jgi:hypothetical protein
MTAWVPSSQVSATAVSFQDRTTAETEIVVAPNLAIRELGWFITN